MSMGGLCSGSLHGSGMGEHLSRFSFIQPSFDLESTFKWTAWLELAWPFID